mgnify:CR=1 FL=1
MKKKIALLCVFVCFCFAGCNNAFAKQDYDSVEKIARQEDRYAKESSVFNPIDGGYSFEVSKFDGRETLRTWNLAETQDLEIEILCSLTNGQGKLVHVDADGNVTTIVECDAETSAAVIKTISLKKDRTV